MKKFDEYTSKMNSGSVFALLMMKNGSIKLIEKIDDSWNIFADGSEFSDQELFELEIESEILTEDEYNELTRS